MSECEIMSKRCKGEIATHLVAGVGMGCPLCTIWQLNESIKEVKE
tara:strand:+ start:2354 stop:2488 length:135 start_codon:yes stop_codon:yes gene_type:complete